MHCSDKLVGGCPFAARPSNNDKDRCSWPRSSIPERSEDMGTDSRTKGSLSVDGLYPQNVSRSRFGAVNYVVLLVSISRPSGHSEPQEHQRSVLCQLKTQDDNISLYRPARVQAIRARVNKGQARLYNKYNDQLHL
jgi:hypothetical protein